MTDLVPAPIPAPAAAWPTTPRAFTDTSLCPRCFAVLPSSLCSNCGLDLDVPLAAELIAESNALVDVEGRRRILLDRMWSEQLAAQARAAAQARMAAQAAVQSASELVPDAAGAAAADDLRAAATTPPLPRMDTGPQAAPAPSAAPRRSGVQVFLLVTGIVLLSVFALFFLTVAYLFATVDVRVVVTAVGGLVTFGVAWVLKRRRLPATGEGVGVAGAAILIGTLGFIRGVELFGSGAIDPAMFWGIGLGALAALLAGLHRLASLRFALVGTVVLGATGVALVIIGALGPVDTGLAWWSGLTAAGASTLLVRYSAGRGAEAVLGRSIAVVASTAALVPAALLLPEAPGASAGAYLISAIAWGALAFRFRRESSSASWSAAASAMVGLAVALAPAVAVLRQASVEENLWLPGAAAGAVATAFVVLSRTSSRESVRRTLAWAQGPALAVAAVGLLPAIGFAVVHALGSLVPQYPLWWASPNDPIQPLAPTGAWAAVLAPGIAAIVGSIAIRLAPLPTAARAVSGSMAGLALLAAASHAGTVLGAALAYLLVAGACLSVLLVTRRRRAPTAQAPAACALAVSALALIVLSHASAALWPPITLAVVGLVVASRFALPADSPGRRLVRASLTAVVVLLVFSEAALVVPWIAGLGTGVFVVDVFVTSPFELASIPGVLAAGVLCATPLIARAGAGRGQSGTADLRAAALVALPVASLAAIVVSAVPATSTTDHVARVAVPLLLAVAGVLWQCRDRVAGYVERVLLATVAPVAVSAALAALADALQPSSDQLHDYLAGPCAAIASAAVGVLVFARASTGLQAIARAAWQGAVSVVVVVAAIRAATISGEDAWSILVLLAVAPLILGLGAGNPFTSTAPRRYFTIASCVLAVAGLWQFLAFRGVSDIEPYSMPVAGLLLAIAAAGAVFGTRSAQAVGGRSALFASGLVVALGPSALPALTASSGRAVVLLGISAALAGAALLVPRVVRGILVRDTVLIVTLALLVVVGSAGLARDSVGDDVLLPELWVLPAAVVLTALSIVWTRRRAAPFWIARLGIPTAIALVGLASAVCLIALPESQAPARLVVASAALGAVSVAAAVHDRVPLDVGARVTSMALLAILGIEGLVTSTARPFELSTTPLALVLIVSGVISLRRDPTARSWPTLGAGVALLLVPSMLADFGSTELWRIIALGVLSVGMVVIALALRWQAPLVVGGVVAIVHAAAQSWPWIQGLYSTVPWWIWLGVGGILLIAVAARYEHRVRNLRAFVGSIAALR